MSMGVYCTALIGVCHFGKASNVGVYTYTAWASALLVLRYRAMRRPQSVGRVTGKVPTLFAYISISYTLIYKPLSTWNPVHNWWYTLGNLLRLNWSGKNVPLRGSQKNFIANAPMCILSLSVRVSIRIFCFAYPSFYIEIFSVIMTTNWRSVIFIRQNRNFYLRGSPSPMDKKVLNLQCINLT